MDNELLSAKIAAIEAKSAWPEGGRDDEPDGLTFRVFPRCYGLARVSRAWSVSRAGVYRFLRGAPSPAIARRRPGPTGPCPDADLADHIRREIAASDFHGGGYRNLWARLRVAGVRSSPRRIAEVMGENRLLAPHRVGRNQEKTHDGTIVTDKVNEKCGERT